MMRALFFEDFEVGAETVSDSRTVTEADVVAFAGLSGDYNPLHVNAEFAKSAPFGERIAHGLLGLAIASGLVSRAGTIEGTTLAFLGMGWRFTKAVLIGGTITARSRVGETPETSEPNRGIVRFDVQASISPARSCSRDRRRC
jgi:acyl dehydratase